MMGAAIAGGQADCSKRIRDANDVMRKALPLTNERGRLVITNGVPALGFEHLADLLLRVRDFADFSDGDDPYNEHDFGVIELAGARYIFKIDYYDRSLEWASENPADPSLTIRVLTVMCVDEY